MKNQEFTAILKKATSRDLVLLLIKNDSDLQKGHEYLSYAQMQQIEDKIHTLSPCELHEFEILQGQAKTISEFRYRMYGLLQDYKYRSERLNVYVITYQKSLNEVKHINDMIKSAKEHGVLSLNFITKYFESIEKDVFEYGDMYLNEKGEYRIDNEHISKLIIKQANSVLSVLSMGKAMCITIEKYAEKHHCQDFIADDIQNMMSDFKQDMAPNKIFSRTYYNKLIKEGKNKEANDIEEFAIYPDYVEVDPDAKMMEAAKEGLGV